MGSQDYTINNLLDDVPDSSADVGIPKEVGEIRFAAQLLDARDLGFTLHTVRAGRQHPFGHRHGEAEEVYVVVSGSGRVKLDDEVHDIGPLDAIRVGPDVLRSWEAGEEGDLTVLAFGRHVPGDSTEFEQGFWD